MNDEVEITLEESLKLPKGSYILKVDEHIIKVAVGISKYHIIQERIVTV